MIRYLQGRRLESEERSVVLDVNGVGYQVWTSESVCQDNSEDLTLWIHTHVREDEISLYGFRTRTELGFFEMLLSVNGIGPKMALAIANHPVLQVQQAILTADAHFLTQIPGVGKKLAERMILELKSKVEKLGTGDYEQKISSINLQDDETVTALEGLGYKRNHIQNILRNLPETTTSTEDKIRWFLGQN